MICITMLKAKNAVGRCRLKINGTQNINKPDFCCWPGKLESPMVPFLCIEDSFRRQSTHNF